LTTSSPNDFFRRALIELCFERGFAAVTVEDLCERAEVERAHFDAAYRDLEDCFAQVYEVLADEFMAAMAAAFDADLSWRQQIRAVAYALLDYLQADHARAHFIGVDSLNAGERSLIIRDSVFAGLFALIDQGREQMDDPAELSFATAQSVGGGIFLQIRLAVEERRFEELDAMVPGFMYSVVLPYLGPEAAAEELTTAPALPRSPAR
jgi:AcrR family transcriptional regulator